MQVLIAAATAAEIAPLTDYLEKTAPHATRGISTLITGVGIMAATAALSRACCEKPLPHLLLYAGIAGAFDRSIPTGEVVLVREEAVGDLGAEDDRDFLSLAKLGLQQAEDVWIPAEIPDIPAFAALRRVRGITVNTVTGSEATATRRQQLFGAQVESMEGAAAHFIAKQAGIPLLHLRAISNYAERRNRAAWKIGDAVQALNKVIINWLSEEAQAL